MVALWNTIKPAILKDDPLAKANTTFGSLPRCGDGFRAPGDCSSRLGPVNLLQPLGKPSRLTSPTCVKPSLAMMAVNYAKGKNAKACHTSHPFLTQRPFSASPFGMQMSARNARIRKLDGPHYDRTDSSDLAMCVCLL